MPCNARLAQNLSKDFSNLTERPSTNEFLAPIACPRVLHSQFASRKSEFVTPPGGEGGIGAGFARPLRGDLRSALLQSAASRPPSVEPQGFSSLPLRTLRVLHSQFVSRKSEFVTPPGGEGGIRTLGTLAGSAVFKTAAIDHSATSPGARRPRLHRPLLLSRISCPLRDSTVSPLVDEATVRILLPASIVFPLSLFTLIFYS